MKKIKIAAFALIAPLAAMCACTSDVSLSFSANWYKNTSIESVSDTYEKLQYKVTFTPSSVSQSLTAEYNEGTYTTELKNELLTLADGTTAEGYVYTTELSISGTFTLGDESLEFEDSLSSVVKFLSVSKSLRPVESVLTVHSTSPYNASSSMLETAVATYWYTYSVVYDAELTTATTIYTAYDLSTGEAGDPVEQEYSLSGGTFLDNEQILFALRGVNLSSSGSFRTLNTVMRKVDTATFTTEAVTESVDFEADGEQITDEISAYSATVTYSSTPSGQSKTAVYAKTTDAANNAYRNVLLRMESPVLESLGTLVYTLTKAEFSTKN